MNISFRTVFKLWLFGTIIGLGLLVAIYLLATAPWG
jgi:hypothetical protein